MKYIEAIIFWLLFPVAILSYLWCFVGTHWMAGRKAFMTKHSNDDETTTRPGDEK